jgi:hypothetical protein
MPAVFLLQVGCKTRLSVLGNFCHAATPKVAHVQRAQTISWGINRAFLASRAPDLTAFMAIHQSTVCQLATAGTDSFCRFWRESAVAGALG